MTKAFKNVLLLALFTLALGAANAQTLLQDTGRGIVKLGKVTGKAIGKVAKPAGRATGQGAKKATNYSARKVSQGTAKLEEKTR